VPVHAVVFDLGETLVDESRNFAGWAEWLDVRTLDLYAALGATIALRQDHRRAFELVRPGFDLERERAAREAGGTPWGFDASDLYPDALPCLRDLRAAGLRIGVVGNQPAVVESMLPEVHGLADVVGSSGRWGVEKPSPAFFERVASEVGLDPAAIAYVGDRLDNDVLPAMALGMVGIFLVRGPWGLVQESWPEVEQATLVVHTLDGLADRLAGLPASPPPPGTGSRGAPRPRAGPR
jgi:FMN phosphatase YigB (HAD superfamily)